ncbi:hypothetical protein D9757_015514 [Collybiopsis confluens]|uniref:Uncharacterized protein n=1 Tax=Collybiopsis confluens TaxID=2823264 RepID=A0A8H5BZX4_9AGAR|nr:hypothetical protein D9757_015514 [Collybiopsis confluens]
MATELVFAILQPNPDEKPTEWNLLKHIPPGAPHTAQYLIISADDEAKGWVSSEPGTPSEETQIQFRVLIVGKSDPPTYPLNQLFEIVPA